MAEIVNFEKFLWAITAFFQVVLLALVFRRKNYRLFPAFATYILATVLQNATFFVSYRVWGFGSPTSVKIAWGTQALVIAARAAAVTEICRHVLAKYRGIWALAWRMLVATAGFVVMYSWVVAKGRWPFTILYWDRGLELAITSVVVLLFLFVHYYRVTMTPGIRTLAIGFFLYSCFQALNNTLLEGWYSQYLAFWNLAGTLAFLASLLLWTWVLREKQPAMTSVPQLLSDGLYRELAPEINLRLRALDEHLSRFWDTEERSR